MKSILLSIKPEWVKKILNGDKTIEVRKKFPKDYKGWVYIYCTKSQIKEAREYFTFEELPRLGKVIARFWCDKVEEIKNLGSYFITWSLNCDELLKNSCLNWEELFDYLQKPLNRGSSVLGYAIHISALEIVNKELYEFKIYCSKLYSIWAGKCDRCRRVHIDYEGYLNRCDRRLTKAPQNFVYIEIEQNEKNNI